MEVGPALLAHDPEPDDLEGSLLCLRQLVEANRVPEARVFVKDLVAEWPDDPRVRHWDEVLELPRVTVQQSRLKRPLTPDFDWMRRHARGGGVVARE